MSFATLCKSFLILKENLLSRWQPELPAGTQPAPLLHHSLWHQNGSPHNLRKKRQKSWDMLEMWTHIDVGKGFNRLTCFLVTKIPEKETFILIYIFFHQYFFFYVLAGEISEGEIGFLEWEWSQNVLLITKCWRGKIMFRTEKKGQTTWRCPTLGDTLHGGS